MLMSASTRAPKTSPNYSIEIKFFLAGNIELCSYRHVRESLDVQHYLQEVQQESRQHLGRYCVGKVLIVEKNHSKIIFFNNF